MVSLVYGEVLFHYTTCDTAFEHIFAAWAVDSEALEERARLDSNQ